jgi:hypothetical protein
MVYDPTFNVCKENLKGIPKDSFPSGHSSMAVILSEVLGSLFPEFESDIRKRTDEIFESRVATGIHYSEDIQAGKKIAEIVLKTPTAQKILADLKKLHLSGSLNSFYNKCESYNHFTTLDKLSVSSSADGHLEYRKIKFHKIFPGKFKHFTLNSLDDDYDKIFESRIEHQYELMDAEMTQINWIKFAILVGETNLVNIQPAITYEPYFDKFPFKEVSFGATKFKILNSSLVPSINVPLGSFEGTLLEKYISKLNYLSKNGDKNTQKKIDQVFPGHLKGSVYNLSSAGQTLYALYNEGKIQPDDADRKLLDFYKCTGDDPYYYSDCLVTNKYYYDSYQLPSRKIRGNIFYGINNGVSEATLPYIEKRGDVSVPPNDSQYLSSSLLISKIGIVESIDKNNFFVGQSGDPGAMYPHSFRLIRQRHK